MQDSTDHIVELLEPFGRCESRRMFGGAGIFHQGLMFGLVADGSLFLKADAQSRSLFEAEQSEAFSYMRQGKTCELSYFLAPEAFFEDSAACVTWARHAYDAALRNRGKRK